MLEWLTQIGDSLSLVWNIFISLFFSVIKFISMIPEWLAFLHGSVLLLPGIFVPFIILGIGISVLFFIMGRN